MAHPQSSGRGYVAHERVDVGTQQLTDDATNLALSSGISLSGLQGLDGNSTAIIHANPESAIPTTDNGAAWTVISNSTGVALAVNTTGTTWKYLNVTSVQPT